MAEDPQTADAVETPSDNEASETTNESAAVESEAKTTKKTSKKSGKKRSRKKTAKKPVAKASAPPEGDRSTDAPAAASSENEPGDVSPGDDTPTEDASTETPKPAKKRSRRKKTAAKSGDSKKGDSTSADSKSSDAKKSTGAAPVAVPVCEMIINYSPGEECRIAILEDGKLEEFDSEPTEHVSRVGNIYVGKVVNIERNIQAAFVDFGVEEAGFLHVSDLHPRYFPGADEDETERVGRKTPRRQRPPIEQALKRGQEIAVQVLKEGVGTKGPTLTSYLSIPGRFLVMMPDMDKVGVSRKVEDEDERRKMRQVLDQLELPDGFGFILRTAGFERTKTELKRDLAYLSRLWKDMERRRKKRGGSRLLYSEADLLLRTLRDRVGGDVARIVIDNEAALRRASAFMKIVSPRASTKLCHYRGNRPVFHAFGIETQLDLMHATEVPLPSGGRLVIEQTEALVAIDVNSGRSRGARDAESNAFQTNVEAVDEICRQLRLRDLGGLVINDMIDMRHASNRKEIENRFKERLKRDKARSTILPISQFGILEMTRQRMRGSFEQQHFQTCPRCSGRGLIQRPDSVAAGALRDLAALLEHERVHRVELVVSPLVAGALLSTRRTTLSRIERLSGKKVDVRVSETISAGRVTMYAYDANGSDIDVEKLPGPKAVPDLAEWEDTDLAPATDSWAVDLEEEAELVRAEIESEARAHEQAVNEKIAHLDLPGDESEEEGEGKKKRRRRRRKRKGDAEGKDESKTDSKADAQDKGKQTAEKPEATVEPKPPATPEQKDKPEPGESPEGEQAAENAPKKKRRRRRRRRGKGGEEGEPVAPNDAGEQASAGTPNGEQTARPEPQPGPKPEPEAHATPESEESAKPKRKRRSLYGAARRTLSASEKTRLDQE
ncbi:MAG: Rne/Rng family ribonuclease [Phycisphaeraceae bacterium]|nr:MAG: Rne/Rng family ribonuclease [Phycisphaeraceae bacterium]